MAQGVDLLCCSETVWRTVLKCQQRTWLSNHFKYQDQSVTFLCVYRPPPSRKNKLSNKMFLDEFPDLLESYVSCDRLFVLGDINFHFDSDSDISVADLKKTAAQS